MLSWKQLTLTQILLPLKIVDFDIVIPVYNASKRITTLLDALKEFYADFSFRVILVDDFSKDNTYQIIKTNQSEYPFEIELIRLAKNVGQHSATMIGLNYITGKFAITLDDDLQHHPREIVKLIDVYYDKDPDLIYGVFIDKKHSFIRNIGSYLLKQIVKLSNPRLVNITAFRLIKKEILNSFEDNNKPIVFLDEYLINYSSTVELIKVEHFKREEGKSSYSYFKLIGFALNIIMFHSSIPLKFITRLGLVMSLSFFGIGCYFIWQKLVQDVEMGFTSIIVSIFFSSGLILFALGIIGEYIRKIWSSQNQLNNIVIRSHDVFER